MYQINGCLGFDRGFPGCRAQVHAVCHVGNGLPGSLGEEGLA